jgi:hypothetical protein
MKTESEESSYVLDFDSLDLVIQSLILESDLSETIFLSKDPRLVLILFQAIFNHCFDSIKDTILEYLNLQIALKS